MTRPRLVLLVLAALIFTVALTLLGSPLEAQAQPAGDAGAETIRIRLPDGRGERQVPSLALDRGRPYIASGDVAEVLRATSYWRSETQKLLLRIDDHRLTLTVDNPFVVLDRSVHRLPVRPRYRAGQVWVPLALFDVLSSAGILRSVAWDPEAHLLSLDTVTGSVGSFDFEEGEGMSILTIRVSDGVSPSIRSTSRGSFVVRLRGAAADPERLKTHEAAGRFAWVELKEVPDGVDLEFAASQTCRGYLVRRLAAPPRIEIRVADRTGNQGELLFRPFEQPNARRPRPARETRGPRLIVLDPGHGGEDVGTRTPGGLLEKHLSLELAARVRRHLERQPGFKVLLVRERDERVEVPRRVELANTSDGDLLLSIHLDLASPPSARRFQLAARSGSGQVVYEDLSPLMPGSVAASNVPGGLVFERWEAVGSGRGVESYRVAQNIARKLRQGFPNLRAEITQLPAWNLEGAKMPAVLIELPPPTGGSADRSMGSGETIESLAAAIAAGVTGYFAPLVREPPEPPGDDQAGE